MREAGVDVHDDVANIYLEGARIDQPRTIDARFGRNIGWEKLCDRQVQPRKPRRPQQGQTKVKIIDLDTNPIRVVRPSDSCETAHVDRRELQHFNIVIERWQETVSQIIDEARVRWHEWNQSTGLDEQ